MPEPLEGLALTAEPELEPGEAPGLETEVGVDAGIEDVWAPGLVAAPEGADEAAAALEAGAAPAAGATPALVPAMIEVLAAKGPACICALTPTFSSRFSNESSSEPGSSASLDLVMATRSADAESRVLPSLMPAPLAVKAIWYNDLRSESDRRLEEAWHENRNAEARQAAMMPRLRGLGI